MQLAVHYKDTGLITDGSNYQRETSGQDKLPLVREGGITERWYPNGGRPGGHVDLQDYRAIRSGRDE